MNSIFVDTYYFLAILNPKDLGHARSREASKNRTGLLLTTQWVLAEVGDALSRPPDRPKFLALIDAIEHDPSFSVVSADDELFHQSIEFFRERPDKEWTFTDCTSFVVMRRLGIREALTADVHFEQAGFVALLKK